MSETASPPIPDPTVRAAAEAFGLDPDGLASIGAFVSEVWSGRDSDGPVVLKVMDPGHRTHAEVAALLAMRQADLTVTVHLEVPEERWDDDLRATVARLRERTVARQEVVPRDVLRRHFG